MLVAVVVPFVSATVTVTVYALSGATAPLPSITSLVPLVPLGTVLFVKVCELPATLTENELGAVWVTPNCDASMLHGTETLTYPPHSSALPCESQRVAVGVETVGFFHQMA